MKGFPAGLWGAGAPGAAAVRLPGVAAATIGGRRRRAGTGAAGLLHPVLTHQARAKLTVMAVFSGHAERSCCSR